MDTITYTVEKGDTLSSIAGKFGTTVSMIAHYNNIPDPDRIYENQVLRIPVSSIPKNMKGMPITYTVQSGDTLASVAARFHTTVQAIARYNAVEEPDMIEAGRVLMILRETKEPQSSESPSSRQITHTVQSGDTLATIAEMHHTTVQAISRANGITDPDVIETGRVLRIPAEDHAIVEYTVQSGDTLWKIAKRYHVSLSELINRNRLTNPDLIYPGQIILIKV